MIISGKSGNKTIYFRNSPDIELTSNILDTNGTVSTIAVSTIPTKTASIIYLFENKPILNIGCLLLT